MLLEKILNLPETIRLTLALCISAGVLTLIFGAISLPVFYLVSENRELHLKREELGRYKNFLNSNAETPSVEKTQNHALFFLSGQSQAVVQANLQSRFNALALENKIVMLSSGPAEQYSENDVKFVGVQISINGTIDAIHNFLFEIEDSTPTLFVKSAKLSAPRWSPNTTLTEEPSMHGLLKIYGAINPNPEKKGS